MIKIKKMEKKKPANIYLDFSKALSDILQHIDNTKPVSECTIFTFGIYAGISNKHGKTINHSNICYKVLKALQKRGTKINIYVGDNKDPLLPEKCRAIEREFGATCKIYSGHHKLFYLSDGWGYMGSANFTGGGIGDIVIAGNLHSIIPEAHLKTVITTIISQ